MNSDVERAIEHPSKSISDRVRYDPDAVDLTVGIADLPSPTGFSEELIHLLHSDQGPDGRELDRYAPSRGDIALRQAIADRELARGGPNLDADLNILVTAGAADAISLAVLTFTSPGDEIAVPDPGYMLYRPIATALGRVPVGVATSPDDEHRVRPAALERAMSSRTRLVILNSPANPTGALIGNDDLRALVDLATGRGAYVLHDEVFDEVVFTGRHVSARAVSDSPLVVSANSFSKRFNMTGWRIGWMAGASEVIAQASKAHTLMSLAAPAMPQRALGLSMNAPGSLRSVRETCASAEHRLSTVVAGLREISELDNLAMPSGGLYLFPNVERLARRVPPDLGHRFTTAGEAVAAYALDAAKVAVVPGIAFGPNGANYVRLCGARSPQVSGLAIERLQRLFAGPTRHVKRRPIDS